MLFLEILLLCWNLSHAQKTDIFFWRYIALVLQIDSTRRDYTKSIPTLNITIYYQYCCGLMIPNN